MKQYRSLSLLVALACAVISCDEDGNNAPKQFTTIDALKAFYVKDVSYNEYVREGVNMETEVHIVDNETGKSLLCAGVDNGLQYVQSPNIAYANLDANFISTSQTIVPELSDFYVVLVERDSDQCPGPAKWDSDTVIGRSKVFKLTLPENEPIALNEEGNATIIFSKRTDSGTSFSVSELTKLPLGLLNISSIPSDELSEPEVEIHFVNVLTNQDIACEEVVDYDYGLNDAGRDYSDPSLKPVLVNKISSTDTASLVRIVLIERDDGACPSPFTVGNDKILGTSQVLGSTELFSGQKITFPNNYATVTFVTNNNNAQSFNVSELTKLTLQQLNLTGIDSDELSAPEVEIHFVNVLTGQDIACEEVVNYDVAGKDYSNTALKPVLANNIASADTASLVQIVLVERDNGACPAPFTMGNDKVLGRTNMLSSTELFAGQKITFLNGYATITLGYK